MPNQRIRQDEQFWAQACVFDNAPATGFFDDASTINNNANTPEIVTMSDWSQARVSDNAPATGFSDDVSTINNNPNTPEFVFVMSDWSQARVSTGFFDDSWTINNNPNTSEFVAMCDWSQARVSDFFVAMSDWSQARVPDNASATGFFDDVSAMNNNPNTPEFVAMSDYADNSACQNHGASLMSKTIVEHAHDILNHEDDEGDRQSINAVELSSGTPSFLPINAIQRAVGPTGGANVVMNDLPLNALQYCDVMSMLL